MSVLKAPTLSGGDDEPTEADQKPDSTGLSWLDLHDDSGTEDDGDDETHHAVGQWE
jgi:hypothetical protein